MRKLQAELPLCNFKAPSGSKSTAFPKLFFASLLFFHLLLFSNPAPAQSSSHNGGQWTSVGGEMEASGSGHFSNQWWAAGRYHHGDGKYWLNDEPKEDKTTHKKIPATHTPEEVNEDIWTRKGQVTVRGPGYLGLFLRSKGAGAALKFPGSGKVFHIQGLGKDEWLVGSDQKWKWVPAGRKVDIDPKRTLGGWVPDGRTMTLDVWVYNPHSDWGIWGNGFRAPHSVEYEFWFFPREGGEVIKVAEAPGKTIMDHVDTPPPGQIKVAGRPGTPKIRLFWFEGDEVEFDYNGTGYWETVTKDMLPIEIGPNGKVITGFDSKVKIDFSGRGMVTVSELTNYSVGEFLITDDGITAHTNMKVGEVNVKVDRKYTAIDFTVSSPTCIAGVRGTEFTMSHAESPMKSTIAVHSGKVEVTPKLCSDPAMTLHAGQRITIDDNCFGDIDIVDPEGQRDSGIVRNAPLADSHVYSYDYRNWNKANWGKYENLVAGWHPQGGEKRAFLKFDLSSIDTNSFSSAKLKLFHYHTGGGNNRLSLGVYAITEPWQEGSDTYHSGREEKTAAQGEISWVNQPSFNLDPIAQFNPGTEPNKFVEVDITSLVMAWLTGKPNHGLLIKPAGRLSGRAPETQYGFYSREHEDTDKHPVLVLSTASEVQGTARLVTVSSDRDIVGRNETFRGNGTNDATFRAQFSAPNRTVTAVAVSNTNGVRSIWDTRPNNGLWLGGVVIGGRTMNRSDGSVNFSLGSGQNTLDFFVEDNGSIRGGNTNYRMTIFFASGDPLVMDIIHQRMPYGSVREPDGGLDGLGRIWRDATSGWHGVWTRRGNSNTFDATWSRGSAQVTGVLRVTRTGNDVFVERIQSSDKNVCTRTGSIAADGKTVTGSQQCASHPGQTFSWSAVIERGS